ncbi:uncharacterized protein LOC118205484 [Stegodyphus dumicola]|uniref:uncharacterized protein LOC118205484 n=1 Tax=Stegodyphus dumicola TaxID=202533 RepID=UPI0015AD6FDE|nr:uncharacterized protein LOC118205484 [Stegodyphus dumicola]
MKNLLNSIQRQHLILVCKALQDDINSSSENFCRDPSLDLQAQREAAIVKVTLIVVYTKLWGKHYFAVDYEEMLTSNIGHPAAFNLANTVTIMYKAPAHIDFSIYTDGSKTNEGTGSAYCFLKGPSTVHTWNRRLDARYTVYQAELSAIKAAITYARRNGICKSTILIGSFSSLQPILSIENKKKLFQDTQRKLLTQSEAERPKLIWVPAHVGIHGNEVADQLAKETANDTNRIETPERLPKSYMKK